jgi:dethiobiotin synthetase
MPRHSIRGGSSIPLLNRQCDPRMVLPAQLSPIIVLNQPCAPLVANRRDRGNVQVAQQQVPRRLDDLLVEPAGCLPVRAGE